MLLSKPPRHPAAPPRGRAAPLVVLAVLAALLSGPALAQRDATQGALSRLEETLATRLDEGQLSLGDLQPILVVSATPRFEETRGWYEAAALSSLVQVFGAGAIRSCEACMAPRLYVEEGRLEQNLLGLTVEEAIRMDERGRGKAPAAKSAIWLDETPHGVSLRIVELATSRVVFAQNFDQSLTAMRRTERTFTLTRELERRARGDSLTHTFIDAGLFPGQHISLDFVEQFGDDNLNLAGLSVSALDPVVGVGASYYRVIPQALDISLGAKVLISVPTAVVSGLNGEVQDVIDPLITGIAVARVPLFKTNYGLFFSASTNLTFTVGISLLNVSLLPVLP